MLNAAEMRAGEILRRFVQMLTCVLGGLSSQEQNPHIILALPIKIFFIPTSQEIQSMGCRVSQLDG